MNKFPLWYTSQTLTKLLQDLDAQFEVMMIGLRLMF